MSLAEGTTKSAADTALLRMAGLTVSLGDRVIVRDVSLSVDQGTTLGIVGESGSGKSLTARSIVGLLPTGLTATGSINYAGTELIGARERVVRSFRGTRISLLLQDPFTMLNPVQTVGRTVGESLRCARQEVRGQITRRLGEVGLAPDVASRYPFQLSGGMRQRVALAAALAGDPELLIADEPTTALDVTTQDEVLRLLKDIQQRRDMGLILITHDLRVAFSVCDRIQVMYAGSVVECASGTRLDEAPAHPYTVGLLLAEPSVDHYVDELVSIPGSVPPAHTVATRCGFADRCAWRTPSCVESRPPLAHVEDDHISACLRLPEIRGELMRQAPAVGSTPAVPAGEAIVRISDVSKIFRTRPLVGRARTTVALDKVGFAIIDGESLGLVGETGSGKTTIARAILGLVTPDSGSIELDGIQVADYRKINRQRLRQVRRFVQVVFQDPYASLNPAMTVGATLREAIEQRGDPGVEPADLLARVGLPAAYAGRLPAALSGGERQRIAIARAVAMRPKLLICDEPVAALDVSAQAQVLELLREIRREDGMSMLFITHDLSVVRQMTDRAVVLYRGRVVEVGPTAEMMDDPRHEYTRRLLAGVPGATNRERPEAAQITDERRRRMP
ncbi:MAG TPA: ABC transporter ATP-binding protein [Pseudonocardiaceae bacterium]|nr:ABC transporter ATP-binding protein [Pseudonocardiaceae bacterium]